jgi:hypothetical protein
VAINIKDTINGSFGRHETFTIRYGWLKRGFDHAICDPALFHTDDMHFRLGVGKNMAKSIRYWLSATRLMREVPDPDQPRRSLLRPTRFGLALLTGEPVVDTAEDRARYEQQLETLGYDSVCGFDPYLEDLGSWWLIHWMLLSPGGSAPVWWSAFHTFTPVVFTTESLLEHVEAQVESTALWNQPKAPQRSTIKKDVLALLRAYAGTSGSRIADKSDDTVDAPMAPLSLIHGATGGFRFAVGPKPDLAPAIATFVCLDFLHRTGYTSRSALVATLATEVGGPGRALKLSERDLSELLAKCAADHPDWFAVRSATGSDSFDIVSDAPLPTIGTAVLEAHYSALGTDDGRGFAPYAVTPDLPSHSAQLSLEASPAEQPR